MTKLVPIYCQLPNAEEYPKVWLLKMQKFTLVENKINKLTNEYLLDETRQSTFLQKLTEGLKLQGKSLEVPPRHYVILNTL